MADKPASERTEQPTRERLRKARQEGKVPQSQEAPSALMIAALLAMMALGGPRLLEWFVEQARMGLALRASAAGGPWDFPQLVVDRGGSAMIILIPFALGGAAVSVFASFIASGWAFAPQAVKMRMSRISPVEGMKQLISLQGFVRMLVSVAKAALIMLIVYIYLRDRVGEYLALRWASPAGLISATGELVLGVAGRIAIGLAAIAGFDVVFQRWRYHRDLRMTREEVKEERKQHEVSPEVRNKIRGVQMEMARKRMLQEVPKADVVVTNPTHVAVALQYDAETMAAPVVLAKGGDMLCQKIKEIARTHDVPVVERPELARTLYAAVDVGHPIPETLFVAVAEVLAMIYRLRRKRLASGQRARS